MDKTTQEPIQQFDTPLVHVDTDSGCEVDITGPSKEGGVAQFTSDNAYISVIYSCPNVGVSKLNALIQMDPFEPIVLHWQKESLGNIPALYVRASSGDSVIANGSTILPWSRMNNSISLSVRDTTSFITGLQPNGSDYLTAQISSVDALSIGCPITITYSNVSNTTEFGVIGGNTSLTLTFNVDYGANCSSSDKLFVSILISFYGGYLPIFFGYFITNTSESNSLPIIVAVIIVVAALVGVLLIFALANYCVVNSEPDPLPSFQSNTNTVNTSEKDIHFIKEENPFSVSPTADETPEDKLPLLSDPYNIKSCPMPPVSLLLDVDNSS